MVASHASSRSRIVITGATRGLGRALTARFHEHDWTVIGCGRSPALVEQLRAEFPAPHRFDVVDVSRADDVAEWARSVLDSHGPPDLLLNNAATINAPRPLWEVPPEEFARLLNVNIQGVFHGIRGFVPAMRERGTGVIVNLSSGWGRSTAPDVAPYCATKWAIEGLTQALAQELPDSLAAVALNPGIIDTDMLRICFGEQAESYPDAERWSRAAAPFLMQLGPADNGRSLTAPGG